MPVSKRDAGGHAVGRRPRRRLLLLGATLLTFAMLGMSAGAETWESIPPNPAVDFFYVPPTSPDLQGAYQAVQRRQVLQELQHFLAPLHLPHHLQLLTRQCNQINAFYSPFDRSLTLCYELIAEVIKRAPQTVSEDGLATRQAAIVGNIVGVLLHEGGHMMFDMLDVPRFGREEDAADENAAFLALQFNKDVARFVIEGFAYFFQSGRKSGANAKMSAFSDEHGTAEQRLYNTLCLAYGEDPQTFQTFVDRGWLPKARAAGCAGEYARVKFAFVDTILPFIDRKLMARVQQAQWLTPAELKR